MTGTEQGIREPLAIVGIGCHLPGGATTPESFWNLLCTEVDATCTVPESRWNVAKYHDPNPAKVGKMVTRRGGFLPDIDQFDAQFFGISPREANLLDPQQRLLLQTTWEALEDGGIPADGLAGTDVGVFIGGFTLDYQLLQNQGRTSRYRFKSHSSTGMMMTMLANRISYAFDLRGPSMTIDTACSSSLVAVHLAAQSMWNGECPLALAGGVNVMIGPSTAIAESKSGFLSPDGRCKAFDESADGYARGEGAAVVVIKPLSQALRDGDDVHAQILGTAVSQDGHTEGITVPSALAQEAAITTALRRAGVRPNDVAYVEAHGTGTPVGDPVEMRALARALASDRAATSPLLVGSVKTNIGHLEAGAGVAGLIKTALVLKHGYIPANLHLDNPSSRIPFQDLTVDIPRAGRPFPDVERRVAGVNSFGFGGTNAHVVLAEPPAAPGVASARSSSHLPLALLPISARSEEALVTAVHQLARHVSAHPATTLADLGYTLGQRRSHMNHRCAVVAETVHEARDELHALADGGQISAGRPSSTQPKLAFVCTGMGPQWWKMCRGLMDVFPAFTESILRSDRELSRHADWSLVRELRSDELGSRMARTDVAQPANFAIQVALAEQLAQFGVLPDAVIGHSAGEVAAHHLAGLLTFEQAVEVIHHRSRLQQRTTGLGRMLAVGLDAESLVQALDDGARGEFGRRVSVAAINSPSAVTIAGDGEVLDDIARQLDGAGVFHRYLTVEVPYHTHYMDAVKDDLYGALNGLSSHGATLPLYSTVTGERLDDYTAGAAYWWQNLRATVLFEPAMRRMLDDGYTHFVELGPHPVLAASIMEIAGAHQADAAVFATQRRNDDDGRTLMNCVATLYSRGHDVDWEALAPRDGARLLRLPSYPWQTKRFWNANPEAEEDLHYRPVHPLLGQPVSGVHPTWEVELSTAVIPFLADHQVQGSVVVPGAVFIEMALAAARETYGSAQYGIDDLVLHRALLLDDTCDPIVRTTLNRDKGTLEFAAFTATADGELKWSIAATAELNSLPSQPAGGETPGDADLVTTVSGEEFYAYTRELGFAYGDAFQPVTKVTSGDGWAAATFAIPTSIAGELDDYRFHPALIDGAFQTLFGAPFLGRDANQGPYLPTRIRQSAIHGAPQEDMTAHVRIVSATSEAVESDITITNNVGDLLAVFNGFTVQSLGASSRMSPERIDKGLYEVQWMATLDTQTDQHVDPRDAHGSWLVLVDRSGVGRALAERLRAGGHHVDVVEHQPVDALTDVDGGYAVNPRRPEHLRQLFETHVAPRGDLAGIVECWPLDVSGAQSAEPDHHLGVLAILGLVKCFSTITTVAPRLYLLTANAQPAPGTGELAVDQATVWGLGRVIGHQEFADHWGGLIDVDDADDHAEIAVRVSEHILGDDPEDQIAIRGNTTFVPRLLPCRSLTKPFPTKLVPDATYVVTGGTGALGRTVATFLAERGARHIVLMSRGELPPRSSWSLLTDDDAHYRTVQTIRGIERLGARVTNAGIDVTDIDQMKAWLAGHLRDGGRPVRGIVHAAGSVADQLLVNMTEADFLAVMAPKVTGARVLQETFDGDDVDFFVMFGSAGSTIASPGQGNYAAANAFLDAFAHHRRARGLPALTIGWGPWSIGMVEELKLENLYAQRGIELISPATGARVLDRLITQQTASVVAITADWRRARQAGLAGTLPPMFSELGLAETSSEHDDAGPLLRDLLSAVPESDRLDVVATQVRHIVAAVFDCAVADVDSDDVLDDLGLDSMMAMDFRLRINAAFSVDLPVLEILRGVSVNSLAVRVLADIPLPRDDGPAVVEAREDAAATDEDVDRLIEHLSEAELRRLLADLEGRPSEQDAGGAQT